MKLCSSDNHYATCVCVCVCVCARACECIYTCYLKNIIIVQRGNRGKDILSFIFLIWAYQLILQLYYNLRLLKMISGATFQGTIGHKMSSLGSLIYSQGKIPIKRKTNKLCCCDIFLLTCPSSWQSVISSSTFLLNKMICQNSSSAFQCSKVIFANHKDCSLGKLNMMHYGTRN